MSAKRDVQILVERAQSGDRAAFDAVAALYRPELEALIRSRVYGELRRQVEVADLVQETLLRAFRGLGRFRFAGEGSFLRWLRGIGVKVVLEAIKRIDRDRYIALEFEVSSEEPSPSRTAQRRERFERFERAVGGLSPDYRTALRLVRLDGLSVNEAARRMNRSPNAVSHLLIRALRKLRETFGETGSLHLLEPEAEEKAAGGETS